MRICVHNCGRPEAECECRKNDPTELGTSESAEKQGDLSVTFGGSSIREQFPEAVRGLAQKLLKDSNFSSALARYNPQEHPVGLVLLKEDGRQMSPEEMEEWITNLQKLAPVGLPGGNISPVDLARHLTAQGVRLTNIAAQCRNDDVTKYYPKTYTIRNVGGDYERWVPGKIYLARTKRGARRFRLQSVKTKEQ